MFSRLISSNEMRPSTYPATAPIEICNSRIETDSPKLISPTWMIWMNRIVRMLAIGSLLPLSNSSSGRMFSLSFSPFDRNIENTEAESVDDITAASSSDS